MDPLTGGTATGLATQSFRETFGSRIEHSRPARPPPPFLWELIYRYFSLRTVYYLSFLPRRDTQIRFISRYLVNFLRIYRARHQSTASSVISYRVHSTTSTKPSTLHRCPGSSIISRLSGAFRFASASRSTPLAASSPWTPAFFETSSRASVVLSPSIAASAWHPWSATPLSPRSRFVSLVLT